MDTCQCPFNRFITDTKINEDEQNKQAIISVTVFPYSNTMCESQYYQKHPDRPINFFRI